MVGWLVVGERRGQHNGQGSAGFARPTPPSAHQQQLHVDGGSGAEGARRGGGSTRWADLSEVLPAIDVSSSSASSAISTSSSSHRIRRICSSSRGLCGVVGTISSRPSKSIGMPCGDLYLVPLMVVIPRLVACEFGVQARPSNQPVSQSAFSFERSASLACPAAE